MRDSYESESTLECRNLLAVSDLCAIDVQTLYSVGKSLFGAICAGLDDLLGIGTSRLHLSGDGIGRAALNAVVRLVNLKAGNAADLAAS